MYRVAIVEDDINCINTYEQYLIQYGQENGVNFQIKRFLDGEDIVESYTPVYDIILMDIEMRFMDGMTAAENIRNRDKEVIIIFVTNMVNYAVKGYAVNAMDFLVKPVSVYALFHSLDRAMERLRNKEKHYLSMKYKGEFKKLDIDDIYYLESKGHDLLVHTSDDTFMSSGTMKEMEEKLEQYHFSRCNKGYLVNLEHVNAITNGMVIVGKDSLVISRPRKKVFQEQLAAYMSEVVS